ncbi:MAG: alginate lyase family protein [Clostridia bacterium]|nr:alginate lyase family protein [Clostridia bacterium]
MKLENVLIGKYTDAEYLARQRELHKARFEKLIQRLEKDKAKPGYVEKCVKDSENSMKNLFVLPGTEGKLFDVGTPPAWNECRTSDEEYLWHLNRMGWFKPLSRLYHLTGESKYAEKVLLDMENWIDTCPLGPLPDENTTPEQMQEIRKFFSGLTPWRSLEVGIRTFDSWNFAYDYLLFSELMTPELHSKIAFSLYEHAVVLREMSPRYWPDANHNHYIHEMLGLLIVACLFPDFAMSDSWREFAIHELTRCARAQFTKDGGHIEGSPHYHQICLNMFFSFLEVAGSFDVDVPAEILDYCKKAADYTLICIGPDKILSPIGDSPYRSVGEQISRDYYSAFGELGPVAKIFAIHDDISADAVPPHVQAEARKYALTAPAEDNPQPDINQYFARTGWKTDDSHFGFICHSPIFNGHAHQDPMSFVLYLKGDPVVVDPSYFTYRQCEERKLFKSPEYHSTLTLGDKPPFEYIDRWRYGPQREGGIRKSYRLPDVFAVDASHHCYDPDYHKRLCALVGDDVFLVADDVLNLTESDVRIYFHMDDSTVKVEGRVASSERIRVLLPEGVSAEVSPSLKSLHTDVTVPSARLILTDKSPTSRQYLTVFTKRDDITEPKIERVKDGVLISYKKGSETVSFLWTFSCSLKRV